MNTKEYEDIINLPHHVSKKHPPMPMMNRAAQFAPFAALTGYEAVIHETGRLTDEFVELENFDNERLNRLIALLISEHDKPVEITIVYFEQDKKKSGGSYKTATGMVKQIDEYEHQLILMDGTRFPLKSIVDIQLISLPFSLEGQESSD